MIHKTTGRTIKIRKCLNGLEEIKEKILSLEAEFEVNKGLVRAAAWHIEQAQDLLNGLRGVK